MHQSFLGQSDLLDPPACALVIVALPLGNGFTILLGKLLQLLTTQRLYFLSACAFLTQSYDVDKVQAVLQQLEDEAPEIMLFLKNIERIEVRTTC
jgi:hypothetical protein